MARTTTRVRIDDAGCLEMIDPGLDAVPLLRSVDPSFQVQHAPLAGFIAPRLLTTRLLGCGATPANLGVLPIRDLWAMHRDLCHDLRVREGAGPRRRAGEGSLLDVKIELGRRLLAHCILCHRKCGVDRTRGETGFCGLGQEAVVAEHFVHIAEEPPINPSLVLSLAGCGLRCRYCQQGRLLTVDHVEGDTLDLTLWTKLDCTGARSLSFVGGNPDESLVAILQFLRGAPSNWALPIVWNCHAYGTPAVLELLEGVVDAFLPDVKYGNDGCSLRLSGVAGYDGSARANVAAMLEQQVPVIARILVLPGHVDCCHRPALVWLRELPPAHLCVSIRGQYSPDFRITERDGPLSRRVGSDEVEAVRRHATGLGLRVVASEDVPLPSGTPLAENFPGVVLREPQGVDA